LIKTLLIIVGVIVGLVVLFIVWRLVATVKASQRRTEKIEEKIASVTNALEEGREPSVQEVNGFAANPETRNTLYEALSIHDRLDLFPNEYRAREAMAEADLVFWLCHPNELGSAPDEIEMMSTVTRDSGTRLGRVDFVVFRYRVHAPHWAAEDGWMAGVAGPYVSGEEPTPVRPGTFSTFDPYDSKSPQEHAEFCHQMMVKKGMYEMLLEEKAK
jgi:hypothetical protein